MKSTFLVTAQLKVPSVRVPLPSTHSAQSSLINDQKIFTGKWIAHSRTGFPLRVTLSNLWFWNDLVSTLNTRCSTQEIFCEWFLSWLVLKKVSLKRQSFKVFNLGKDAKHLPGVKNKTKNFLVHIQRGALPCKLTQSKKTNRSCCFACGWCLSGTQKRKPREQKGSVTLSFPHSEVLRWFTLLCKQRTLFITINSVRQYEYNRKRFVYWSMKMTYCILNSIENWFFLLKTVI